MERRGAAVKKKISQYNPRVLWFGMSFLYSDLGAGVDKIR